MTLLFRLCAAVLVFGACAPLGEAEPTHAVAPGALPPSYLGKVTAVSGETITIKPQGNLKITATLSLGGGKVKPLVDYVQDNTKPPHTFVFSDELLHYNGTLPSTRRTKVLGLTAQCGLHKISDVQVGDVVWIECRRVQGTDTCIEIKIQRRPGGRVPPAYADEKREPRGRIDNQCNAEQFAEETFAPKWVPWMLVRFGR